MYTIGQSSKICKVTVKNISIISGIRIYILESLFGGGIKMSREIKVRLGWLKFMYVYTIVIAGGVGLGMIFVPDVIRFVFSMPNQDPIILGMTGSLILSFAILSIFGLRDPLKFIPILMLQLSYKTIWLIVVILPLLVSGRLPMYTISIIIIFVTYVIGDLIAIPFSHIFTKRSEV